MTRLLKTACNAAQLVAGATVIDGIWRVSIPAALIVAGAFLFAGAEAVYRGVK